MHVVSLADWIDERSAAAADGRALPEQLNAFLLAELPLDAEGSIRLSDQQLDPVWRDVPESAERHTPDTGDHEDTGEASGGPGLSDPITTLQFAVDHDLPDPDNPFEYWRWTLIADRLDILPPPANRYGDTGNLMARHYADLWRIGLARIEAHDQNLAHRIRRTVTRVCRDDGQPFACWNADPADWSAALTPMLTVTMPIEEATARLAQWCDAQARPLAWIEQSSGDRVRLTVVNPGDNHVDVRIVWHDATAARRRQRQREQTVTEASPAMSDRLAAGQLRRFTIARPALPQPLMPGLRQPTDAAARQLRVDVGDRSVLFGVGDPFAVVKPPGLSFFPFQPAATLNWIRGGEPPTTPSSRATTAIVRRLHDRWEVFIECYRPDPSAVDSINPDNLSRLEHLPGHEAVTLFIGNSGTTSAHDWRDAPDRIVFTVPMRGDMRTWRGTMTDVRIERRLYADRWLCRVILPERFLVRDDGLLAGIGLVRTHSGRLSFESSPGIAIPWRIDPGLRFGDFSQWDE